MRVNFNDKRELLLSRAKLILRKYKFDVSDIQYTIIGAMLSDTGRHSESLQYYKRSVEVASSKLERAWARRPYGRALILAGNSKLGRAEMLSAAAEFEQLSREPGLDADRMRSDKAEVFRRLIWAELQAEDKANLYADYKSFGAAIVRIKNAEIRKPLQESELEISKVLLEILSVKDRMQANEPPLREVTKDQLS